MTERIGAALAIAGIAVYAYYALCALSARIFNLTGERFRALPDPQTARWFRWPGLVAVAAAAAGGTVWSATAGAKPVGAAATGAFLLMALGTSWWLTRPAWDRPPDQRDDTD